MSGGREKGRKGGGETVVSPATASSSSSSLGPPFQSLGYHSSRLGTTTTVWGTDERTGHSEALSCMPSLACKTNISFSVGLDSTTMLCVNCM